MTPEARTDQLLAQDVGDETVVYDERTFAAHRLNRTASLVWRLANGRRSVGEMATVLHKVLDVPDDEDFVRLGLAELDKAGLLAHPLPEAGALISRRELFGVAAALLPLVVSIVAPTPAMAATAFTCNNTFKNFTSSGTLSGSCGTSSPPSGSIHFKCDSSTNRFTMWIWDDVNGRVQVIYEGTIDFLGNFEGKGVSSSGTVTGLVTQASIHVLELVGTCEYKWNGVPH